MNPYALTVQLLFIRAEKKKRKKRKRKCETQNANAQYAQSKRASRYVNFLNGSCSISLQPNLKPNFVNFLK